MSEASSEPVDSLRQYVRRLDERDMIRTVEGADWEYEVGALTEIGVRVDTPKALLFDNITDYDEGKRILSAPYLTDRHHAVALNLDEHASSVELVREWKNRIRDIDPIEPNEVATGPVLDNTYEGDEVNIWDLPVPIWHEKDGGRFIGTGNAVITRGPEDDDEWNWVNAAVYRNQVHDENTMGLFVNQTNQAVHQMKQWWERGEAAPIVIDQGPCPFTYSGACMKLPKGMPELAVGGGLKGEPIDVIQEEETGLPVPATSEIAMIGEVPPPEEESELEGPFGECFGYYAGGSGMEEERMVVNVEKLWHRNNPILKGCPELKDQAQVHALGAHLGTSARAWQSIEQDIESVQGVYSLYQVCQQGSSILVVSIEQEYAGHAQKALHAAMSAQAASTSIAMVVVVDEDIDPSDTEEVFFAMCTRATPAEDIQIIDNTPTFELDPRTPPEARERGDFTNSCMLVNACIPWEWKDEFPEVVDFPEDMKAELKEEFDVADWD